MIIEKNRVVSIDYTLSDDNGAVLDSTSGSSPLDYLHGHQNIISGLEKALEGKTAGDSFSIRVEAAEAYGERDERLVVQVPLDRFDGEPVEEGMQFQAETPDGCHIMTVTAVKGNTVTVDGNHPLAGIDLQFALTVTAVREANDEELAHGHVHHAHTHGHDHGECGCNCEEGCSGCGA